MRKPAYQMAMWRVGLAGLLAGGLMLEKPPLTGASQAPTPGVVYTFPAGSAPTSLLVDTNQDLWVSLASGNALVRLTSTLTETRYPLTPAASQPFDLALGPDRSVWFSQLAANQVGRFDSVSGLPETFARATTPGDPTQVAAGQDGRMWFTEFSNNRLGWIWPDGRTGLVDLPTPNSRPLGLALDADGNVWFTEWNNARVGRIDTQGQLSEIPLPPGPAHPAEIIQGPDQAMWFTYDNAAQVGRVDLVTQETSVYPLASGSSALSDLVLGADGRIWFIGYQTIGSFAVTPSGPADVQYVSLDSPIFNATGCSQILQGSDARVFYIKANSDNLYTANLTSVDLRDLQVYIDELPAHVLSSGPLDTRLVVYNASQAQASGLKLEIDLPAEFTLRAATPSAGTCQPGEGELVCEWDTLAGDQEWTVQLSFDADQHAGPALQRLLAARVSADQADYLPANNRVQRNLNLVNTIRYAADFSDGADAHWSPGMVTSPDGANPVLGPFANDTVEFSFTNLPLHDEIILCFNLFVLGDWDGDQAGGPDAWGYSLDGQPVLASTFSNRPGGTQGYPVSSSPAQSGAVQTGDFNSDGRTTDARYKHCRMLTHNATDLRVLFSGDGLDHAESWALDNVSVQINFHDGLYYQILMPIHK